MYFKNEFKDHNKNYQFNYTKYKCLNYKFISGGAKYKIIK